MEPMEIINDIISNIPFYCLNDELKTFTYIYVKIATMLVYDDYASELIERKLSGYDREMAYDNIVYPASDIRCLKRGKAICSGFAEVLDVILNKLNIKTIKVRMEGEHTWNQVLINGKWYNCDLTNDYDFIMEGLCCSHFLKSNSQDNNFIKRYPTTDFQICEESISDELQEQLINEALTYVRNREMKTNLEEPIQNYPIFIQKFLNIFNKKESGVYR